MSQSANKTRSPYFRSLDDLNQTPEFEQFLDREFPEAASEFPDGVSRRRWLQLMGASLALGGLTGCRYNREEIAAFVVRPEGRVPGVPNYFSTNFEWAGETLNLLVKSMDGRPIKVDGNPQHPVFKKTDPSHFDDDKAEKFASAGSSVKAQAAILSLYDPDRLNYILDQRKGVKPENRVQPLRNPAVEDGDGELLPEDRRPNWGQLVAVAGNSLQALQKAGGAGLAIVYESTSSPSLARALASVKKRLPKATLVEYEPFSTKNVRDALAAANVSGKLGYDLTAAEVIVDLDAGLICTDKNAVLNQRAFAAGRNPNGKMNRLYSIESNYSSTGSAADYRLPLRPSDMPAFVAGLESAIDAGKATSAGGETEYSDLERSDKILRAIEVIADDLMSNKGKSLVAIGPEYSVELQQAVLRINQKLSNVGTSIFVLDTEDPLADVESIDVADFAAKASKGEFTNSWILATNPVFGAPSDLNLAEVLGKIENNVYLSCYDDETASVCQWVLPTTHPLESWGDVRAVDGTYGVCQPQIAPLLDGKDPIELLGLLSGAYSLPTMNFVMETATAASGKDLTERDWNQALHDGFIGDTASKPIDKALGSGEPLEEVSFSEVEIDGENIDIQLIPSEVLYDGRLANNSWLQEVPQAITKLVWDNAALMSNETAATLGVEQGEKVAVKVDGNVVEVPTFILPGHADSAITISVGYGRTKAGSVGGMVDDKGRETIKVGHDVTKLMTTKYGQIIPKTSVRQTTIPYQLVTTQDHFALDDFGLEMVAERSPKFVREGTKKQYDENHGFAQDHLHHPAESLWEEPIDHLESTEKYPQWGMSVDLNKCSGCNACVVACQAENNIPVVGKDQVSRGREMHWLRIDRYFKIDIEASVEAGGYDKFVDVSMVSQPVACMHCETAACEQVCPVAATVHTEEGINAMAYNRCIGTRYCANNCAYKVRRFNYYNYNTDYGYFYGWQDKREEANKKLQSLVLNPEVTVRGRGVMEKCTYCVQRVQNAKITAKQVGDGQLHDGDVKTACQEACSSQAIQFGDISDPQSRVSIAHRDPRTYGMLEELNSKPRTKYLAKIKNVPERLMTRLEAHPPEPEAHGDHGGEHHGDSHGESHHDGEPHGHGEENHGHEKHTDHDHADHDHAEDH